MNQQSKHKRDIQNYRIAQLEAKLHHAYQTIESLEQQNKELEKQIYRFRNNQSKQTNILVTNTDEKSPNVPVSQVRERLPYKYQLISLVHLAFNNIFNHKFSLKKIYLYVRHYKQIVILFSSVISLFYFANDNYFVRQKYQQYDVADNKQKNQVSQNTSSRIKESHQLVKVTSTKVQPSPQAKQSPQVKQSPQAKQSPKVKQSPQAKQSPKVQPSPKVQASPKVKQSPQVQASPKAKSKNIGFVYNVQKNPTLNQNRKLDNIVQSITKYVRSQGLPTKYLSLTLIDLNSKSIAGYRQHTRRYPASVVKLFWMVAIQDKIHKGLIKTNKKIDNDLRKMVLRSDNNSSSRVLDWISETKSKRHKLGRKKFNQWQKKRLSINRFFRKAAYKNIYLAQKTFPIYDIPMVKPVGPDRQIRNDNTSRPQRNKITTYQAARLMSEIVSGKAITPKYSQKMMKLLKRKLRPTAGKKLPSYPSGFHPLVGFLGQSLSADRVGVFASKAGWTSFCRLDVAYVESKDKKTRYILAVFGNNRSYSKNSSIFPRISKRVFHKMKKLNQKK